MIGAKPTDYYDLISVDMERFKLFNDVYGMKEGDQLLQYIAEKLNSVVSNEEGICARFNADRFMLLYPHHGELKPLVNDIRRYLDRYATQGMKLRLKYGIYHATDSSLAVTTMCDRANWQRISTQRTENTYVAGFCECIQERFLQAGFTEGIIGNGGRVRAAARNSFIWRLRKVPTLRIRIIWLKRFHS